MKYIFLGHRILTVVELYVFIHVYVLGSLKVTFWTRTKTVFSFFVNMLIVRFHGKSCPCFIFTVPAMYYIFLWDTILTVVQFYVFCHVFFFGRPIVTLWTWLDFGRDWTGLDNFLIFVMYQSVVPFQVLPYICFVFTMVTIKYRQVITAMMKCFMPWHEEGVGRRVFTVPTGF